MEKKILFIGSKDIGHLCLQELFRWKCNVVGVVARPDDPENCTWYKSVTKVAEEHSVEVFKSDDVNDPAFVDRLKKLGPDILFTAQYPQLYKKDLIQVPREGCLNLHFAPLPDYRGCFPIAWAIIDNSHSFGVTIHHINEQADAGNIIAQNKFEIQQQWTGRDLYNKCTTEGLNLFRAVFPQIVKSIPKGYKQGVAKTKYHNRKMPFDGNIDWDKPSLAVYNFVRSLYFPPFPPVRTFYEDVVVPVTVVSMQNEKSTVAPGTVTDINSEGVYVATKDSIVVIKKVRKGDDYEYGAYQFAQEVGLETGAVFTKENKEDTNERRVVI